MPLGPSRQHAQPVPRASSRLSPFKLTVPYRARQLISRSHAESTVNYLVNARMNECRQMRWSPLGAHRVLQVRTAVLDGRSGSGIYSDGTADMCAIAANAAGTASI